MQTCANATEIHLVLLAQYSRTNREIVISQNNEFPSSLSLHYFYPRSSIVFIKIIFQFYRDSTFSNFDEVFIYSELCLLTQYYTENLSLCFSVVNNSKCSKILQVTIRVLIKQRVLKINVNCKLTSNCKNQQRINLGIINLH